MAFTLSTGLSISVAATYGSTATVTAASNASPCQLTTQSVHGLSVGDYVEVSSGWDLLDGRVVRCASGTSGSTIVLEGVDTTDTNKYPATTGTGSVRDVATWSQLSQLKSISSSGGTQNFADITTLSNLVERKMPTNITAVDMTVEVFDDPTLPWYAVVNGAFESSKPRAILMQFKNGSKLCANAYVGLNKVPNIATNEALTTTITLSYAAESLRYAS